MVSEQAREIGDRLRKVRLRKNLSQEEVAYELGLPVRSYKGYESGRNLAHYRRRRAILAWLEKQEAAA